MHKHIHTHFSVFVYTHSVLPGTDTVEQECSTKKTDPCSLLSGLKGEIPVLVTSTISLQEKGCTNARYLVALVLPLPCVDVTQSNTSIESYPAHIAHTYTFLCVHAYCTREIEE